MSAGKCKAQLIREKMSRAEVVIGGHVFYIDPSITEALGCHGFEFVWIDGEHSAFDKASTLNHIMAAAAADTASIVTVPYNYDADIVFYGQGGQPAQIKAGMFYAVMPHDAHMPCIHLNGEGAFRKIVLKIKVAE